MFRIPFLSMLHWPEVLSLVLDYFYQLGQIATCRYDFGLWAFGLYILCFSACLGKAEMIFYRYGPHCGKMTLLEVLDHTDTF